MARDTVSKTLLVAALLCIVCASLVSGVAVGLRDRQNANRKADVQKNILVAAGIYDETVEVSKQFENVESILIDLETGKPVEDGTVNRETYDPRKAANDSALSIRIDSEDDLAGIKRREKYAFVYQVRDDAGAVESYVFPVNGKGLWSTLYGMMALESDLQTVKGMIFYEHKETPGLGGEVENPNWYEQWEGKKAFDDSGTVRAEVLKGQVNESDPNAEYRVDGMSGATITSRGVTNLLRYWLGENGFGPYIDRARQGEVSNG